MGTPNGFVDLLRGFDVPSAVSLAAGSELFVGVVEVTGYFATGGEPWTNVHEVATFDSSAEAAGFEAAALATYGDEARHLVALHTTTRRFVATGGDWVIAER